MSRVESSNNQCSLSNQSSPEDQPASRTENQSLYPSPHDFSRGADQSTAGANACGAEPLECRWQDAPEEKPEQSGVASLVSKHKKQTDGETLAALKKQSPPQTFEEQLAQARAEGRQEVLDAIDRMRVPQLPLSRATEELWQKTSEADGLVEKAAGAVATAGMVPLALSEEVGRSVLNVPANAAAFGAHLVGTLDTETGEQRLEHAKRALEHGLKTAQGITAASGLSAWGANSSGSAALGVGDLAAAGAEQAAVVTLHNEAEGADYAQELGAAVVGGTVGKLSSSVCGNTCGGALGQLTEDALAGKQSSMENLAASGLSNKLVNDRYEGAGSQFISSELTLMSQGESLTGD